LKVRFERPVGGALGEGAVVSEGGCLPAVAALSHLTNPFLAPQLPLYWSTVTVFAMIPKMSAISKARHFTIQRNLLQDKLLK
jgi:hypothetical protein